MKIALDKPTRVVKQREVAADISEINVNRIVINFRLGELRAFTEGGGAPIVLASGQEFQDLTSAKNLDLADLTNRIKNKVLAGDTGRAAPAVPAAGAGAVGRLARRNA